MVSPDKGQLSDSLPHFLIIGERRCGTSNLVDWLSLHPDIFLLPKKDPAFFMDETAKRGEGYVQEHLGGKSWEELHTLEEYAELFKSYEFGEGQVRGEKSADYFFHPKALSRIARFLPDIRLIVSLRDPVQRAWSLYWTAVAKNRETLPFSKALEAETGYMSDPYKRNHMTYRERGCYAKSLSTLFDFFDPKQIYVTFFERRIAEPQSELCKICRFLGVDENFAFPESVPVPNANPALTFRKVFQGGGLSHAARAYRSCAYFLAKYLSGGNGKRQLFLQRYFLYPICQSAARETIPEEIQQQLREFYLPDIQKLKNLLQDDIPEWEWARVRGS